MMDSHQKQRVLRELGDWRRREQNPRIRASLKTLLFAAHYGRSVRVEELFDARWVYLVGRTSLREDGENHG